MQHLVSYFLHSSMVMVIGYLIYRFIYQNEGYFAFNRIYLLATLAAAILLPLASINIGQSIGTTTALASVQYPVKAISEVFLNEVTIFAYGNQLHTVSDVNWTNWLVMIYLAGFVFGLIRLSMRLIQLTRFVLGAEKQKSGGLTFVIMPNDSPVFSFFHYVFLSRELLNSQDSTRQIIAHEQQHARQLHSLDMLVAELATIVFWFNPFIYLLKNTIRENHEFMADEAVLSVHPDTRYYSVLLVNHAVSVENQLFTHNFSYSLLKRRLFMMKNVKNPMRMVAKLLWIFIGSALAMVACSDATKVSAPESDHDITAVELNIAPDSVSLATMHNFEDGNAIFLLTLGKKQQTKLEIFNQKNELIATLLDAEMGPGSFDPKWTMTSGMDYFSYVLTAGDKRITGNASTVDFSYNEKAEVFTVVEQMPEYPGGVSAMMSYLGNNIKYPEQAKRDSIAGRVFVSFIVETDGRVTNVKILRGIGGGCDEEAIRVVSSMPNWKPGMQRGEAVRVAYNLPIKFALH